MAVLGLLSVTLEVPDLDPGLKFYLDAGLSSTREGEVARLRCRGQNRDSIVLLGGADRKRLHHLSLRADDLKATAAAAAAAGGNIVDAPPPFAGAGVWLRDPHGMLIHLTDHPQDPEMPKGPAFEVNGPGRIVRRMRSAVLPGSTYPPAKPLRLGHVMVFTPDVRASVAFMVDGLGMGLADQAQDIIAFCCAKRNSDHHVVAFAKSSGTGLHHVSFQVADPDEVGRGGRALHDRAGNGEWGFGRHTIGSNFFHYIQDPWGSWFEYYSDMDFIDDHALWTAKNYDLSDSLANWGPAVPPDFVQNYEVAPTPFLDTPRNALLEKHA